MKQNIFLFNWGLRAFINIIIMSLKQNDQVVININNPNGFQMTMTKDKQVDLSLQHTVHQDMINVLQVAIEYEALLDLYKNDPDNQLLTIHKDRLLSMLDISNSIHYDLWQNLKNDQDKLKTLKQEAKKQTENVLKNMNFGQQIKQLIQDHYIKKNLDTDQPRIQQIRKQIIVGQLTDKNVQKAIKAMQDNEKTYERLRQGKGLKILTDGELIIQLNERKKLVYQTFSMDYKYTNDLRNQQGDQLFNNQIIMDRLTNLLLFIDSKGFIQLSDTYGNVNLPDELSRVPFLKSGKQDELKQLDKQGEIEKQRARLCLLNKYPANLATDFQEIQDKVKGAGNAKNTNVIQFTSKLKQWFSQEKLEKINQYLIKS